MRDDEYFFRLQKSTKKSAGPKDRLAKGDGFHTGRYVEKRDALAAGHWSSG
jgi:hypothetical protein